MSYNGMRWTCTTHTSLGLNNLNSEGHQRHPSRVSTTYCISQIGKQVQYMSLFQSSSSGKDLLMQHSSLSLLPSQCSNRILIFLPWNKGEYGRLSWLYPSPWNHSLQSMIPISPSAVPHQAQYPICRWHRTMISFFNQHFDVENRQNILSNWWLVFLSYIWHVWYILYLPLN